MIENSMPIQNSSPKLEKAIGNKPERGQTSSQKTLNKRVGIEFMENLKLNLLVEDRVHQLKIYQRDNGMTTQSKLCLVFLLTCPQSQTYMGPHPNNCPNEIQLINPSRFNSSVTFRCEILDIVLKVKIKGSTLKLEG